MKLRIAQHLWTRVLDQLLAREDVESAGMFFAESLDARPEPVAVIREGFVLPNEAFTIRQVDRLQIDPVAINRLVRPARDRGLSVITVHTHPGAKEPWFSWADDHGDLRLMPSFEVQIPDVVHGSMVVVPGRRARARVHRAGEFADVPLWIVGDHLESSLATRGEADETFARQELALGEAGQARLRRLRVGVVGAGGTGSIIALQVAHMGVAELVVMDGDLVERSNRPRILGTRPGDVGVTPKVEVIARYVEECGLQTAVAPVPEHLVGEEQLRRLRACDVVFSCVDRHTPRAMLNRLAYAALVPVIDMGTAFRVDRAGAIVGDSGRVVVVGPGRPCLGCWGHIDPGALRTEALTGPERDEEVRAGYITGATVAQPSVIAFNCMVAGAATVELLRLAAGFGDPSRTVDRLSLSFVAPGVRPNRLEASARCRTCEPSSG